ncbi:MAG: hypothetical protein HY286_09620 [Planctomycetes bacterium]|nr:hypothetical protein [Planctomycetota bacterium]
MMRILLNLVWREWRNERALMLGAAAALPAILAFSYIIHFDFAIQAPGLLLAIVAGALAADVCANDSAGRRIETLCSLPVRPAMLWAAKSLFLLVSTAAAAIYLVCADSTVAFALRTTAMTHAQSGITSVLAGFIAFAWVAAACVSVASVACANALGGLVSGAFFTGGLVWLGVDAADYLQYLGWAPGTPSLVAAAIVIICIMGTVAGIAFCYLRARAVPAWRKFTIRAAGVAIITIASVAGADAAAKSAAIPRPGDANVEFNELSASPDGKWIAARVSHFSRSDGFVWTFDVENSRAAAIDAFHAYFMNNPWTDAGKIQLLQSGRRGRFQGEDTPRIITADPATGAIVNSREATYAEVTNLPRWASVEYRPIPTETRSYWGQGIITINWTERGLTKKYKSRRPWVLDSQGAAILNKPGTWLGCDENGRLIYYDLAAGSERVLREGPVDIIQSSKNERRAIVITATEKEVIDVDSGACVAGPWPRNKGWVQWLAGDDEGRFVIISDKPGESGVFDILSGRVILTISRPESAVRLGVLEKIAYVDGGRIRIADLSGGPERTLYR